jgi:outer membrane lipoprotein-sorting protein
MRLIIILILFISQTFYPQTKNPNKIINDVVTEFNRVKDYVVDVNIKIDVEFLKVPETKAKIYFKQPDKVHLDAEGFAMLPKNGMEFSPSSFIKKDYTAIYEKDVVLNGNNTSIVKVIPLGDQGDVILSTLWVDQEKKVIRKLESTTKLNGTFTIDFTYDDKFKYTLPSKIIFSFNLDKMNIPSTISGETNTDDSKKKKNKNTDSTTKGKVIIKYSNYVVNKGVLDSVFEEKKEK